MSSDLLDKCEEYFNTRDFYEVLQVSNTATQQEIKKAYYKLSLLVHPDRVEEHKKAAATEKFKLLCNIHSILQDPDKKSIYDESGSFDEDDLMISNWLQYWRSMFKRISTQDIDNHKKEYIGSEAEKKDIKRAYASSKGSMDHILEMVPFSNYNDEARITEIVRQLIDEEEVEEYRAFFNEPQKKKDKRRRKWEEEEKQADELNISDNDIALQIQQQQEAREKNMGSFFKQLEAKYASKPAKRKSIKGKADGAAAKKARVTRSSKRN